MDSAGSDQAALELVRVQRARLADRLRPPWWYLTGVAVMYALVFAFPFASRFLGVSIWVFFAAALVVAVPLQWGWTRATGVKMGFRNLSSQAPGRAARYAAVVVSIGAIMAEHALIDGDLLAVAAVVAALAVAAEVALQQVLLRGIRRELRDGGAA
jgi:hypothetical protein